MEKMVEGLCGILYPPRRRRLVRESFFPQLQSLFPINMMLMSKILIENYALSIAWSSTYLILILWENFFSKSVSCRVLTALQNLVCRHTSELSDGGNHPPTCGKNSFVSIETFHIHFHSPDLEMYLFFLILLWIILIASAWFSDWSMS